MKISYLAAAIACFFLAQGCDKSCDTNRDCDDGDPCNGVEGVCRNDLCTIQQVPTCCEVDSDCDDGRYCNGEERCASSGMCEADDPPCDRAGRSCNETMDRCICAAGDEDADDDGVDSIACGGLDCDDDDGERAPGRTEVCDADDVDEDCDPSTFGDRDQDGDGYVDSECANELANGETAHGTDCNDRQAGVHPGLPEACNDVDDDCDRMIDEGARVGAWRDQDGDGYGAGEPEQVCAGVAGYAAFGGDCDDELSQVHPGAFRCLEGGESFEIEFCDVDGSWEEATECPGEGQCVVQPDGTGVCLPGDSQTYQCSDGADNDADDLEDWPADPQCASPLDNSEGPRACSDGADNDMDGKRDFPDDPGCTSSEDGSENDPAVASACANGLDDDGDGTRDYLDGTGDPGCVSAADTSEREPTGPQCDNGVDDDGDTFIDFPADQTCGVDGPKGTEVAACNDGIDNDGDGHIDQSDTGCAGIDDDSERVGTDTFQCDDGIDNDGDGATDFPGDIGCTSAEDGKED